MVYRCHGFNIAVTGYYCDPVDEAKLVLHHK